MLTMNDIVIFFTISALLQSIGSDKHSDKENKKLFNLFSNILIYFKTNCLSADSI